MENPYIYLRDISRSVNISTDAMLNLAYYKPSLNVIVINRKMSKISDRMLLYIIDHEFMHSILHRLKLYRARVDLDNLPRPKLNVRVIIKMIAVKEANL